jgi:hypothetical protein
MKKLRGLGMWRVQVLSARSLATERSYLADFL